MNVKQILDMLFNASLDMISLQEGHPCFLLLAIDLYSISNDEEILNSCYSSVDNIIDKIHNYPNSTLGAGLTGGLYSLAYMKSKRLLDADDDFFDEYNDILISFCENCAKKSNYDLLYGIVGVGIYFLLLSKMNKKYVFYLKKVIHIVCNISIKKENGLTWNSIVGNSVVTENFGLLHGIPSIISFLLICKKENINDVLLDKTLASSLTYLISKIQPDSPNYSYNHVLSLNNDWISYSSRLAYCYGDLGIINMYLLAYIVLQDDTYRRISEIMMIKLLKRLNRIVDEVNDICFCHGLSGIYYLVAKSNEILNIESLFPVLNNIKLKIEQYLYEKKDNFRCAFLDGDIGILFSLIGTPEFAFNRIFLIR